MSPVRITKGEREMVLPDGADGLVHLGRGNITEAFPLPGGKGLSLSTVGLNVVGRRKVEVGPDSQNRRIKIGRGFTAEYVPLEK